MSRLDSFIRRITAQRDVLDHVCRLIADRDGPILELGLGNGRTYHHLREKLPHRRIIAFDRVLEAHLSSRPSTEDLILGEIFETAPRLAGIGAVLVHADIETAYEEIDRETARWLSRLMPSLLAPGGLAACGLALSDAALEPIDGPPGVPVDRYFLYRRR